MRRKTNPSHISSARKEFLELMTRYEAGDLSRSEFSNKSFEVLCASFVENQMEKQIEYDSWFLPALSRNQQKEALLRHLRHLRKSSCFSEESMRDLAAMYNFSVPAVCAMARNEGLDLKGGSLRAGRPANEKARRPFRIFNFARVMALAMRETESQGSLSVSDWKSAIIEVFRTFLPRPVILPPSLTANEQEGAEKESARKKPVQANQEPEEEPPPSIWQNPVRELPISARRNVQRPVKFKHCIVVAPEQTARTCRLYMSLISCRNFLEAWEEIERVRWMRLPGYVGLVYTDCLLDGPPVIFALDELLPRNEFGTFRRYRREHNAYTYFHRAFKLNRIRDAMASNARRLVSVAEFIRHSTARSQRRVSKRERAIGYPRLFRPTAQPELTDEQWMDIFKQAQAEVGMN